jgi:hypothetical protein
MAEDAWYEVYVYTIYMNNEYSQRVQIRIAYEEQTPIIFLELRFCFYNHIYLKYNYFYIKIS